MSWILAAWTATDSKQPSTSTTMCRFLPFVFSHRQFHLPYLPLLFSHSGNQWSRSLDSPCARYLFASFLQDAPYFIPQPADLDFAVKTVCCWIRWKVLRQLPPFTPWIHQMQYRICQFSLASYTVAHSLIQWLYFLPLFIWQVARVRLSHFFHILILP